MFMAAYRNTERSARAIMAKRHQEEMDRTAHVRMEREAAERAAREAAAAERQRQIELAEEKIRANLDYDLPYRITIREIERRICKALRVRRSELHSSRRSKEIVLVRQAVMYWATRLTASSYPEIGRRLGGFDHTTVMHAKQVYPIKRAKMGRHLRRVR